MHYSSNAFEHVCGMWQPYLFSDICQICQHCSLSHGWMQWLHMWCIYVYTSSMLVYQIFCIYGIYGHVVGSFVSNAYLAKHEKYALQLFFSTLYINVGSFYTFDMLDVWLTYSMWQTYLFSNNCLNRTHALCRALYRQLINSSSFIYIKTMVRLICLHILI